MVDIIFNNVSDIYPALAGYIVTSLFAIYFYKNRPIYEIPIILISFLIFFSGFLFQIIADRWEQILCFAKEGKELTIFFSVLLTYISNRILTNFKEKEENKQKSIILREEIIINQTVILKLLDCVNLFPSSQSQLSNLTTFKKELEKNDLIQNIESKSNIFSNLDQLDMLFYYKTYYKTLLDNLNKLIRSFDIYKVFYNENFLKDESEIIYIDLLKDMNNIKICILSVLLISSTCITFIDLKYIKFSFLKVKNELNKQTSFLIDELEKLNKFESAIMFSCSQQYFNKIDTAIKLCYDFHKKHTDNFDYKIKNFLLRQLGKTRILFVSEYFLDFLEIHNDNFESFTKNEIRLLIGISEDRDFSEYICKQKVERCLHYADPGNSDYSQIKLNIEKKMKNIDKSISKYKFIFFC